MTMSSPVNGQIKAPAEGMPRPGQHVKQGQPILTLVPILSPDTHATLQSSLVDAEGMVKAAKTQVDAALIELKRAQDLFSQDAGPKRTVDQTQAAHDLARKNYEMVEAQAHACESDR